MRPRFAMYILQDEDTMDINPPNPWVTITIEQNSKLSFSSPSGSASTVYKQTAILLNGKVKVDKLRFLEACEAGVGGSFGDNYLLPECGPSHLGGTSA
jgi:hypothetical protein